MPLSLDLMQLENGDDLVHSSYDILVNEFLFQLGIQIGYLKGVGEKMFQDCNYSWQLVYKVFVTERSTRYTPSTWALGGDRCSNACENMNYPGMDLEPEAHVDAFEDPAILTY